MIIDLIKNKNNYIWVSDYNPDNVPTWYPTVDSLDYTVTKLIDYSYPTFTERTVTFVIGWKKSTLINNITLDIASGDYDKITMQYSMDDWIDGFSSDFANLNLFPRKINVTDWDNPATPEVDEYTTEIIPDPIYLNEDKTIFKSFECKCLVISFTECSGLTLNDIKISSDETINIDKSVMETYLYEKFINKTLKIYNDTDVKGVIEKMITMLDNRDYENSITIQEPLGGYFLRGDTLTISWLSGKYTFVDVYKDDVYLETIDQKPLINGLNNTLNWVIPLDYTTGSYKFRIKLIDDDTYYRVSESVTIYDTLDLAITKPTSSNVFVTNRSNLILWTQEENLDTREVKIDLYKTGSYVETLVAGVTDYSYSWDIPSGYSVGSDYSIRIINTQDTSDYVESDDFSISIGLGIPVLSAPAEGVEEPFGDVTFTWSSVVGATGYELRINGGKGSKRTIQSVPVTTDESITISDTYIWQVRAYNDDMYGDWSDVSSFIGGDLNAPVNLLPADDSYTESGTGNITFSWDAVINATGYVLDIDGDEITVTKNYYEINLPTDVDYDWKVKAINTSQESDWSVVNTVHFVSLLEIPLVIAPVDGLYTETTGTITYSWEPVTNATGYVFEIDGNPTATIDPEQDVSVGVGDHNWRVKATNVAQGREGEWTIMNTLHVVLPITTPVPIYPPDDFNHYGYGVPWNFTIDWANVSGGTGNFQYKLFVKLDGSPISGSPFTTTVSEKDFSLYSMGTYTWTVRGEDTVSGLVGDSTSIQTFTWTGVSP